MALSAVKRGDLAPDKGHSLPAQISASEPVRHNSKVKPFTIDAGKKSEETIKATQEKVERITELMENYVQSIQKNIKFQVSSTGDISIKVISEQTGKVIREIPSQEMLALAARMEELSGIIFDQKV